MQNDKNNRDSIAYAMDFASYLVSKVTSIDRVILYGSVARGDFDNKSDVDLFIDTREKNIEKQIKKAEDGYLKTEAYRRWSLKGYTYPFSFIIGRLDSSEWKDLKRAIANTGIVLYGKYMASAEKTHQYVLISFESIKPESKRITVYRKLFGFTQGKKQYAGLANKTRALKIGKGALLVPLSYARELIAYFHEKKAAIKVYDIWSDEDFTTEKTKPQLS